MMQKLLGALAALWLALAGVAQATPVVSVSSWTGPSYLAFVDAATASQNAAQAAYLGASTYGTPDTPSYYGGAVSSVTINQIVATQGFFSWNGGLNPAGAYANQFGNEIGFTGVIDGNGAQVSLSQISFGAASSDPNGLLSFNIDSFFGYGIDAAGTMALGVVHGPNGDTFITSGGASQLADEIIIAGVTNGLFATCFGCSEDDQRQAILDAEATLPGTTTYTGTFTWSDSGGGIPNNNVRGNLSGADGVQGFANVEIVGNAAPEPASIWLVAFALLGVGGFTSRRT